jgi:hypothetical protein
MKYTLTTYLDGKKLSVYSEPHLWTALRNAANTLGISADEYEITNERGDVVAYAYTEDSPKAIEKANDYAADMKEARADMARDIQRDELASRKHCGAGKS